MTGVLLAIALADLAGFTWWSPGLTVAGGLAVGSALHLGDAVLEVPFSAMLILSNATRAAAVGRIAETAIGTARGLSSTATPIASGSVTCGSQCSSLMTSSLSPRRISSAYPVSDAPFVSSLSLRR